VPAWYCSWHPRLIVTNANPSAQVIHEFTDGLRNWIEIRSRHGERSNRVRDGSREKIEKRCILSRLIETIVLFMCIGGIDERRRTTSGCPLKGSNWARAHMDPHVIMISMYGWGRCIKVKKISRELLRSRLARRNVSDSGLNHLERFQVGKN
jgi:hypothetical protein